MINNILKGILCGTIPLVLFIISLILVSQPSKAEITYGAAPVKYTEFMQLIGYWDLRDRDTFFQVTNTSSQDIRIHIQIYDVDNNCFEFNYFDTMTPFDTHVYNVSELDRNNGNELAAPVLTGGHGIMAVTLVNPDGSLNTNPFLSGNFRIIDESGYEYRTNLAGNGIGFLQFENDFDIIAGSEYLSHFNDAGGANHADIIVIGFIPEYFGPAAGIVPAVGSFSIVKYDENENPISCPDIVLGCPVDTEFGGGTINVGINQFFSNSRGGPSLCLGTDNRGFVEIYTNDFNITEPFFVPLTNLIVYKGINNGAGIGSMDLAFYSAPFIA